MNEACKKELESTKNMKEVFNVLTKYYDLNSAELTFVTRIAVISGIKTAIKLTNPKENEK